MRQQKFEAALQAILKRVEETGGDTHVAHNDRARYSTALREIVKLAREALIRDN